MGNGIHGKYIIKKADGSRIDPEACYFILRLDTDEAAQAAARAYAEATENEELSDDLLNCLDELQKPPCGCREAWCEHESTHSAVWRYGESNDSTLESQLKRYRDAFEAIGVCDSQKSTDRVNTLEYAIELCQRLAREALEEMDDDK